MTLLASNPKFQAFDSNGNPLVGGKLYTYAVGTTTPKSTYTNAALSSANTNPVILDARGEAVIYLGAGSYKFILKDADDSTIWSVDAIDGGASGLNYYSYVADTGTANACVISVSNGPGGYSAGQVFLFNPAFDNTAATTLNVNGLGAKAIVKNDGDVLGAGDLQANMPAMVVYDGSAFKLLNPLHVRSDASGNVYLTKTGNNLVSGTGKLGLGIASPAALIDARNIGETTTPSRTIADYAVHTRAAQVTNQFANVLGVSDGSTIEAAICAYDAGSGGAQGWIVATGNNTTLTEVARFDAAGRILFGNIATAPAGYTNAGDVVLPTTGKIRAKNTPAFFVNFNGTGTISIRDNINIASVTDNGVGDYSINLSVALASTNACVLSAGCFATGAKNTTDIISHQIISTTRVDVFITSTAGAKVDWEFINVAGIGG